MRRGSACCAVVATVVVAAAAAEAARPADPRRLRDDAGVVFRDAAHGPRFHPLASFGELNAAVTAGRGRKARRLAAALLARARPVAGTLVWESSVPVGGGRGRVWTSGLTQAVAAQALARVGLLAEARRAFRAIPGGLVLATSAGPWIRIYSFGRDVVLNAQLQAALSLGDYARLTGDPGARALAQRLRDAAAVLLPRFDTGTWSRYDLNGGPATLAYHVYVTSLLWKLRAVTGNPAWGVHARRFRHYWKEPPRIEPGRRPGPVYPLPRDGYRDAAPIRFRLSKPATVTLAVAGRSQRRRLGKGEHLLWWSPGKKPPGRYNVELAAADRLGNRSERLLARVEVRRDTTPPRIAAGLAGVRLAWKGIDDESPWLDLRLLLRRGERSVTVRLGRRAHDGELRVPLALRRTWHATLESRDSFGNLTTTTLGTVGGLARIPE